jgi:hypothetical protein
MYCYIQNALAFLGTTNACERQRTTCATSRALVLNVHCTSIKYLTPRVVQRQAAHAYPYTQMCLIGGLPTNRYRTQSVSNHSNNDNQCLALPCTAQPSPASFHNPNNRSRLSQLHPGPGAFRIPKNHTHRLSRSASGHRQAHPCFVSHT